MEYFDLSQKVKSLSKKACDDVKVEFEKIDEISEINQQKVLHAFQDNRISETHFAGTTGYGYDDRGREALDAVYAQVFGCEDALVRHHFVSGTHALCTAFFGLLRPGQTLLSVTGKPYDTLDEIIGIRGENNGSLKDFGIGYRQVDMTAQGVDFDGVQNALTPDVRVVFIQRSKGYASTRPTLSCDDIEKICAYVKQRLPQAVCMIDNCYGEFVEDLEPTSRGADIAVGSLIKNPGGGMALCGAYIAGKKHLVEQVSYRTTSPGIGRECGASIGQNVNMFKGLFFAPHIVAQSLKTAVFCSSIYKQLGFEVFPEPNDKRGDIIQAICFNDEKKLIAFCQGIQKGSPIDSFVTPQPWDMPGYSCPVIMAAGGFVQGASIELSADAPIRPPYIAYMQGGLTFESGKLGIMMSVQAMLDRGLI